MRLAIATCKVLPEPDPDQNLLIEALKERGIPASLLAWDDPDAPFADHDLVVVRSTWNYITDVDGFLAWAERTAARTRLFNPATILRDNARKTYLRDLATRGVDIVPTMFLERGQSADLAAIMQAWPKVVVKPTVSAGSFRTMAFADPVLAQVFFDDLAKDHAAMIQKWMPAVEGYGERSLVYIDGAITHAVRKAPRFGAAAELVQADAPIADDERSFAESVLAPIAKDILYARVDTIRDAGTVHLMELELIEPSLFLKQCPPALARLVDAIAARLGVA